MAPAFLSFFSSSLLITFICFTSFSCLSHAQRYNVSKYNRTPKSGDGWSPAGATWYGSPDGAGSDGGACAYGGAVGQPPFSSMVAAGGPSLFKSGKGCGACYQVKCTKKESQACTGNPVTVVITDECPGGACSASAVHFDLSGRAFGAMALSGKADALRNVGQMQIQYRRVSCKFPGSRLTFKMDPGSNPYYFSVIIEFLGGDGDLAGVDLAEERTRSTSNTWLPMQQSWGANWKLNSGTPLQGPFSIRLRTLRSGKIIVARDAIPVNWKPGALYNSLVNYS